jgi:hypothetical protein
VKIGQVARRTTILIACAGAMVMAGFVGPNPASATIPATVNSTDCYEIARVTDGPSTGIVWRCWDVINGFQTNVRWHGQLIRSAPTYDDLGLYLDDTPVDSAPAPGDYHNRPGSYNTGDHYTALLYHVCVGPGRRSCSARGV